MASESLEPKSAGTHPGSLFRAGAAAGTTAVDMASVRCPPAGFCKRAGARGAALAALVMALAWSLAGQSADEPPPLIESQSSESPSKESPSKESPSKESQSSESQASESQKRAAGAGNRDLVEDPDLQTFTERMLVGGKRGWGPEQIEGPPDVPRASDDQRAWASASQDDQPEWVLCEYRSAVTARAVSIYENLAPGALVKLTAFNEKGDEIVAWEGTDPTPATAERGVSLIPVRLDFPVQRIKLYIDSPAVPNWNEIDAVGLEDENGTTHWVAKARASSTYASPEARLVQPSFSARQATGEPNVLTPGSQPTAWRPAVSARSEQWLALTFSPVENPTAIVIHENSAPGGVTRIGAFDPDGKEVVAWKGTDPTPPTEPWGVSVFPVKLPFRVARLKVYFDLAAVPGAHEVDAVGLRTGAAGTVWATSASASSSFSLEAERGFMVGGRASEEQVRELADEVERLQRQVDELKNLRTDFDALMKKLGQERK